MKYVMILCVLIGCAADTSIPEDGGLADVSVTEQALSKPVVCATAEDWSQSYQPWVFDATYDNTWATLSLASSWGGGSLMATAKGPSTFFSLPTNGTKCIRATFKTELYCHSIASGNYDYTITLNTGFAWYAPGDGFQIFGSQLPLCETGRSIKRIRYTMYATTRTNLK